MGLVSSVWKEIGWKERLRVSKKTYLNILCGQGIKLNPSINPAFSVIAIVSERREKRYCPTGAKR